LETGSGPSISKRRKTSRARDADADDDDAADTVSSPPTPDARHPAPPKK
jgi:hypothetical protein